MQERLRRLDALLALTAAQRAPEAAVQRLEPPSHVPNGLERFSPVFPASRGERRASGKTWAARDPPRRPLETLLGACQLDTAPAFWLTL